MPTKFEITQKLVTLLDEPSRLSVDQAMVLWWANLRDNGGLRLTELGLQTFVEELELESYTLEVPKEVLADKRTILNMDRKISCPYFLDRKKKIMTFFGSRDAMMATLYGNVASWLRSAGSRDNADDNVQS
jgi:hypothetical protein